MRRKRRRCAGFSVLGVLVLLALAGLLAGLAVPVISAAAAPKRIDEATAEMRVLARAIQSFWWDCRQFPNALSNLQANPFLGTAWKGPYAVPLISPRPGVNLSLDQDPWNTPYVLTVTGTASYSPVATTSSITITSLGPDQTAGTGDELAQVVDITFLRSKETADDIKVVDVAIQVYNAQFLATAPLPQDLDQIFTMLRNSHLLPSLAAGATDDLKIDGWGDVYVPSPGSGPVTAITSTHVGG